MYDMFRNIHMWLDNGIVYCMEDGDYTPTELDVNVYSRDANEVLNLEIQNLEDAGYKVVIGKPFFMKEVSNGT